MDNIPNVLLIYIVCGFNIECPNSLIHGKIMLVCNVLYVSLCTRCTKLNFCTSTSILFWFLKVVTSLLCCRACLQCCEVNWERTRVRYTFNASNAPKYCEKLESSSHLRSSVLLFRKFVGAFYFCSTLLP